MGFVCLSFLVPIDACAEASSLGPALASPTRPVALCPPQANSVSQSQPAAVSEPKGLRRLAEPGESLGSYLTLKLPPKSSWN